MNSAAVTTENQHQVSFAETSARLATAANVLSWAVLAGGGTTIALAVYVAVLGHSRLPFWDQWMQIDFAANEGPGHTLDWLWRQFNQHRVVVPKLFLLADLRWFRATQTSLVVSNLVLQFLHLYALAWSMRVLGGWRGPLWRTAVGLLAFCLFCPSQWPNLVMGFTGLCCYLPPLFASLSFLGLLLYWRKSRDKQPHAWLYLLMCMVAALCATFSLSNGNLVWPLLAIGAALLRIRSRAIAGIVAVAAAGISAFFYNYTVYLKTTSFSSAGDVLALIKYIAVYFGSSWVTGNIRLAEILGIVGFLALAMTLWQMPSSFKVAPAMDLQFGLLLIFVLATGVVTAPGRVVFGIDQAFSGRYQSFALLFWGCMAVLLLGRLAATGGQSTSFVLAQVAILVVMLFAANKAQPTIERARWHGFNINVAAAALETGVPDEAQLAWAHSHPDYPRSLVPFMRAARLSVFTRPEPFLLGEPLQSQFRVQAAESCAGGVDRTSIITAIWPRSLRIDGWAWDSVSRSAPAGIIVANDGIISGLGVVGDRHERKQVSGEVTGGFAGFTAYVRDVSRTSKIDIYAVPRRSGDSVCRIASLSPE